MKNNPSDPIPDSLVVFDGPCVLCNRALEFYFNRLAPTEWKSDPNKAKEPIYYTAAQSPWAQRNLPIQVLQQAQIAIQTRQNNQWLSGPSALWPLITRMTYPWRLLLILRLLPKSVTSALYRFIAQRRYRWFGTQNNCTIIELPPGHRQLHQ